jgi:uncharacterized membrane protein
MPLTGRGGRRALLPAHPPLSARSVAAAVVRPIRREPLLWLMVAVAAAAYAVYSMFQYAHFGEGYDLGIFDQTVYHYSHFQVPASSLKPLPDILADHFSPILALLAPLFWLWDDARTLLLVQALLLALAAVPIFLIVRDRLGRIPAYLLTASYLVFWGIQAGVASEFHELAFAPLLMSLVLLAVERARWGWYWVALIALLCVKEDFSLFAIFLGLYLLTMREWRRGAVTLGLGVVWYVVVIKLIMPALDPQGVYVHWMYGQFGSNAASAAWKAVSHPGFTVSTLFGNATKRHTLEYLFVPFLCLSLCSRAVLLVIPLVAERFLSTFTHLWTTHYYYSFQIAAILVIGSAFGIQTLLGLVHRTNLNVSRRVERGAVLVLTGAVLVLNVQFARGFPINYLIHSAFYATPPFAPGAARAVALIPPSASVAAQDTLVPHLSARQTVAEITHGTGDTDYIVANVINSYGLANINGGLAGISRFVDRHLPSYTPVGYFDGWLVLQSPRVQRPLPRTRALRIESGPAGARLWAAYGLWFRTLKGYFLRLELCRASAGCYSRAGPAFRAANRDLDRTLSAIRSELTPGCSQLLGPAAAAASQVSGLLEKIRRSGELGDPRALAAARAQLRVLTRDRDGLGFLIRFGTLCHVTA